MCQQRGNAAQQILNVDDRRELSELTEYANKFHYGINPAWEMAVINDNELVEYVRRALEFVEDRAHGRDQPIPCGGR